MSDSPILLLNDKDGKNGQLAIERRLKANAFAKRVFEVPPGTPERWRRIFQVWYGFDRFAVEDHKNACDAAAEARATIDDPKYGLTKASRGKAPGEEVNNNIQNSLVAIMPERLKAWLIKYDPLALDKTKHRDVKEARKIWRKVYATFPMYRTTTHFKGDY